MGERIRSLARRLWERSREEAAFSIAELLVATLLLFVLTFGIINFADQGVSLSSASVASSEVNQDWRETIETMTRQIRVAYYFVPNSCTASALCFCSYAKGDATKYKILYRLTGTNLEVALVKPVAAAVADDDYTVLASGVQSLAFAYYDSKGAALAAPIDVTQIARVEISMKIARSYNMKVGTSSEGHRLENDTNTVYAEGTESVAIRNTLTATW